MGMTLCGLTRYKNNNNNVGKMALINPLKTENKTQKLYY